MIKTYSNWLSFFILIVIAFSFSYFDDLILLFAVLLD